MRKLGAITLAAYYLSLTTGMFVCLVHCSADYLFSKAGMEISEVYGHDEGDESAAEHHEGDKEHDDKKPCGEGKDCSCCNQHGNYVVKENTSRFSDFQLTTLVIAVHPVPYQSSAPVPGIYRQEISWHHATGPPLFHVQPLYIFHNSLLI